MKNMVRSSKLFFRKNGTTILTCMGAAGVVGTAVLTADATTKAHRLLQQVEKEKGAELTTAEKIKLAWPTYIPAVMLGAGTIACIFGANIINKRMQASLMSSYALLDQTFKEYRNKVNDIYGEDANEKIEEALKEEKTLEGEVEELWFDEYSQRFFRATKSKVQRAEYVLNRNLVMRDYAYLGEWYEELGLENLDPNYDIGWSVGANLDMYWQSWVDFSHTKKTTDDGEEYTVIYMMEYPIDNFADYF